MERALKLLLRTAPIDSGSRSARSSSPSPSSIAWVDTESAPPDRTASSSLQSTESRTSANKSPLQLLKWTFRDKKELIATIGHFGEVNDQLLEMVRFLSLASDIGVDLRHLEHLQTDDDAEKLGLHDDASLALTVSGTQSVNQSFELEESWNIIMEEAKPIEDRFAVFSWNGSNMLRESHAYLQGAEPHVNPQTRNRINLLAKLLFQPKEKLFCIPPCQGWSYSTKKKQISYLFEMPSGLSLGPRSLLLLLTDPKAQPSLGMKFHIAHSLARSIAQLHMVKWVRILDI